MSLTITPPASNESGLGGTLRARTSSGLGGALRAPLGPVVAPLVPRCALLPAPTPRMMGLRHVRTSQFPKRWATNESRLFSTDPWLHERAFRPRIARRGGSPREGV